ncbi:DUF7344 domain-containing protein [Haladaptatus sp. DFWS20]|uniref:DUF7344 domain-containing protein n=1 Tax=Haladaptatus sp. DFWS20 TaxID=3403467 RepID=UPI003EBE9733
MKEMTHTPLDICLDALANNYRRRLLIALLEHNPQDDTDTQIANLTIEDKDVENLRIQMTHTHLPKLEDAGFIEWNRETNEVRKGPRFDDIRPLVQLMHTHADELPDGWL